MNNLNSVLLDGNCITEPRLVNTAEEMPRAVFTIESKRFYRVGGELKEEIGHFDIVTFAKSAERCVESISIGRNVRVVGRLTHYRDHHEGGESENKYWITADHVDFGPYVSKSKTEDQ